MKIYATWFGQYGANSWSVKLHVIGELVKDRYVYLESGWELDSAKHQVHDDADDWDQTRYK